MGDTAIRVSGLGKLYRIGAARNRGDDLRHVLEGGVRRLGQRLRGRTVPPRPAAEEDFWAIKDVSFEVKRGECVGVIGRNGAGKSTLLKLLSRITEPTTGEIGLRGRVGSLLEVGTGFHPELTGRENVYLNGSVLGMSRREVRAKFDEIVAFSEVEKFLDTPVKRYSSGMYVRLAFAVAAHLEPEILIVDEVLAVGDAAFQKKCLGKLGDATRSGRTVLFVSHNTAAIQAFCTDAVLLKQGRLTDVGLATDVLTRYLESTLPESLSADLSARTDRGGNGRVRLDRVHLEDGSGTPVSEFVSGMEATFVFRYSAEQPVDTDAVDIGLSVHTPDDRPLFLLYSSYTGQMLRAGRSGEFRCRIPRLPLSPGRYKLAARVVVSGDESDWPYDGIGFFEVGPGDFYHTGREGCDYATVLLVDGTWEAK